MNKWGICFGNFIVILNCITSVFCRIAYRDTKAKELINLLNGTKTMLIRGAAGRKIPYGRVKVGETVYLIENNGDGLIKAKGVVVNAFHSEKLTAEESEQLIKDNAVRLQLTPAQIKRWNGKRYLCLVELKDVITATTKKRGELSMKNFFNKEVIKFVWRFTIAHVVTYAVFGILFMLFSNYFDYFSSEPIFSQVMKPSDALSVRLAVPVQFLRGALLALAVFPFREIILQKRYGWIKLFWLLFVLTSIGAVITGPGSIEGFLYTNFEFNPLIGYPEISLQMLAFSWLFCRWQGTNPKTNHLDNK